MEMILVLLLALAVIAAVGHAIWLAAAALLRLLLGAARVDNRTKPAPDTDREATQRYLRRLVRLALLDQRTADRVLQADGREPMSPGRPATTEARATSIPAPAPTSPPATPPVTPPATPPIAPRATTGPMAEPAPAPVAAEASSLRPAPPSIVGPKPPRLSVGDLLTAFMQEKNIRWGELVGGLLIVFCSAALVISLWAQIARLPLAQLGLFTTITAALFASGLYVERQWRLPNTSRGLLIIATLLVPLNFLLISAFGQDATMFDPRVVALEIVAVALFGYLLHKAAAVYARGMTTHVSVGVVALCAAQLLARRVTGPGLALPSLWLLGTLPLAVYGTSVGAALVATARRGVISTRRGRALLVVLGVTTFAAAMTGGLLVHLAGGPHELATPFSTLVALHGLPGLATGLLFFRARYRQEGAAWLRLTGTTVGVVGLLVMLAGIALAWPQPGYLLAATVATAGIVLTIGVRLRFAEAQALGAALALLAAQIALLVLLDAQLHWRVDSVRQLTAALLSGLSGRTLVPGAVALAAIAARLHHRGRTGEARWLALPTAVAIGVSIALVVWHGIGRSGGADAQWVAPVCGLYAALAIAAARSLHHAAPAWAAAALVGAATVHLGVFILDWSWPTALLALATLASVGFGIAWRRPGPTWATFHRPAVTTIWLTTVLAAALLMMQLSFDHAMEIAHRGAWLAALWLVLSAMGGNRVMFTLGQIAFAGAAAAYVAALTDAVQVDAWLVQRQAIALALVALAWAALRWLVVPCEAEDASARNGASPLHLTPRPDGTERALLTRCVGLLRPGGASPVVFDQVLAGTLVLLLVGLTWAGIMPFVEHEWTRSPGSAAPPAWGLDLCSWALLAILLAVAAVTPLGSRPGVGTLAPAAVVVATGSLMPLLAAMAIDTHAGASALRFAAAGFVLVGSTLIWLRGPLARRLWVLPLLNDNARAALAGGHQAPLLRALVIALAGTPIVLLSVIPALRQLAGLGVVGPGEASVFARMGPTFAYTLPLAALSLALVGHALRECRGGFAHAGALVGNLTVTLAYLLALTTAGRDVDGPAIIHLLQLNAIWAGLFSLAWVGLLMHVARRQPPAAPGAPSTWLTVQTITAATLALAALLPAISLLLVEPRAGHPVLAAAGDAPGWFAAAGALAAVALVDRRGGWRTGVHLVAAGIVTVAALIALAMAGPAPGSAFVTLVIALVASGWLGFAALAGLSMRKPTRGVATLCAAAVIGWIVTAAVVSGALALRSVFSGLDFTGSAIWWAAGPMLAAGALLLSLAVLTRSPLRALHHAITTPRPMLWGGMVLVNLAAALLWAHHWAPTDAAWRAWFAGLLAVQVIALLPTSTVSLGVDRDARHGAGGSLVAHLFAAAASTLGIVALLLLRVLGSPIEPAAWAILHAAGLLAAVVVTAGCLWDARGVYASHALYLLLAAAAVLAIDVARPATPWLHLAAAIGLGALALVGGGAWALRLRWVPMLQRAGVAAQPAQPRAWLLAATATLAVAQIALILRIVLGEALPPAGLAGAGVLAWRLTAAAGLLLTALGFACLAHGRRPEPTHHVALATGALAGVLAAWACTDPAGPHGHAVQYAALALLALVAAVGLYTMALPRGLASAPAWRQTGGESARWLLPAAAAALVATLVLELLAFTLHGEVVLPAFTTVGVAIALALAAAAAIQWAVAPQHDPLRLPTHRRPVYVYAAEAFVALIFVHVRLAAPWLFAGMFEPYWPLLVMVIAFAGVGLGAWFERRRLDVLARPVARTALFLPLLPVLGFWVADTSIHYSALLLIVGVFYGLLALNRRSFVLGILAAIAANGALWYVLDRAEGYGLIDHPQLWLIPLALSVLIAAQLNRAQLTAGQLAAIRYACLSLAYLASTVEMFIQGVADAPWLPLVLAGLSIAGVMLGIALRVQSFLFMGCGFLVLALLTMLYHASANLGWTWVWYAAGLALGVLILLLFAGFEHRRERIIARLDTLRRWQA
ncbi:MAG: hypothetical protein WD316_06645 [Phycisphaeraceae bacterium]